MSPATLKFEDFMMALSRMDEEILAWGNERGLGFLSRYEGGAARFTYVTNKNDDCYQISVQDPNGEDVSIYIFPVEIHGRDNFKIDISSSVIGIRNDLDFAYSIIMGDLVSI